MISCPHCHSTKRQIKAGFTRFGSQRYFCHACQRTYTPVPKVAGRDAAVRQQAVRYSLEGLSQRKVARLLGVAPQSVSNWVAKASARLQEQGVPMVPAELAQYADEVVEQDELYTFCNAKGGKKTKNTARTGFTSPQSSTAKPAAS